MRLLRHPWLSPILLVLLFCASRLPALESLPLHNDEGLHLTRAVQVWNGHPFWQIDDGKIINHWLIAIFDPRHEPVFVSRFATVIVGAIGLAAGYAMIRRYFGAQPALLAGGLWITSPYLFFYERLALSDTQAGAWVVVLMWAALRLSRTGRRQNAIMVGLILGTATLFKLTAVPFVLAVLTIVLLLGRQSLRERMKHIATIGLVMMMMFSVPVAYLLLRGSELFGIALEWLNPKGNASGSIALVTNLERLSAQLFGFGHPVWVILLLVGLTLLVIMKPAHRTERVLLLSAMLPMLTIVVLGSDAMPRHYVVGLPLLLILAGAGLGSFIARIESARRQFILTSAIGIVLAGTFAPFMMRAFEQPEDLHLPILVRQQYVTEHSAGYGLRIAVESFSATIARPELSIIGSMFRDSCRRANFHVRSQSALRCVDAPGIDEIMASLETDGAVYVLVEGTLGIGVDVTALDARASQIAAYPRPGETLDTASVILWLLERESV